MPECRQKAIINVKGKFSKLAVYHLTNKNISTAFSTFTEL